MTPKPPTGPQVTDATKPREPRVVLDIDRIAAMIADDPDVTYREEALLCECIHQRAVIRKLHEALYEVRQNGMHGSGFGPCYCYSLRNSNEEHSAWCQMATDALALAAPYLAPPPISQAKPEEHK